MIEPEKLFNFLNKRGISNFCGVPDSLLKNFCSYVSDNTSNEKHIITANEGSAVAFAVGNYLASGKLSLVYMQNSGFGNAINPLVSIADEKVYSIPMILMVGWRGEPGVKDEPQHKKQGAIMEDMIKTCGLKFEVIDSQTISFEQKINGLIDHSIQKSVPVILLVKKNTFSPYTMSKRVYLNDFLTREQAIGEIIDNTSKKDIFVSTTGMASRELFEIRKNKHQHHEQDFLTVGSMGHANMIALGMANVINNKLIFCIDGDGASIMHLGNLTSIGQSNYANYIHILINNGCHDSVGGQPTCAYDIDLVSIALAAGYESALCISTKEDIKNTLTKIRTKKGPHFIEIRVKKGARKDLGRPTNTPNENKKILMKFIQS